MHQKLVADIIFYVGKENITNATHCFTRLRLIVKDMSAVDKEGLSSLKKVMKVVEANGQLQIVIGNEVTEVFKELMKQMPELSGEKTGESGKGSTDAASGKISVKGILNTITSIFTPTIPAMAGAGVIKGFLVLLTTYGLMAKNGGTYQILSAASDSIFYFMPLILGYTAAKVFDCSIPMMMAIGGSLIYPSLVSFMAETEYVTFLGIPVVNTSYASTVIPIILAAFVYSRLEKLLDRVIPSMIKAVVAPLISLVVMVPATMLVFGPFGNYTSELVGSFFQSLTSVSPLLSGAFFGGTYSLLVMFGMHRALVPIGINEVSAFGSTALWAFSGPANFSQAGAALGTFFRLKDKEEKSVALSAAITALFGITEPALYGVNLKYKRPMIAVISCGAIGGAIAGAGGARAYAVAIPSVLTIPAFLGKGFGAYMLGIAVAFFAAAIMAVMLGINNEAGAGQEKSTDKKETEKKAEAAGESGTGEITAPLDGKVILLSEAKDETFASGILGYGAAIIPSDGKLYAPVNGELISLFPTNHALGIRTEDNRELLIHIGIDTVKLEGKYFKAHVNQGQKISRGQLLVEFDHEAIRQEGYDTTTMVIVTGSTEQEMQLTGKGEVKHGDSLIYFNE